MTGLRILKRKEIDEQKWNALIHASLNSLPYALTYYLDAVAENWGAVVLNDYETVLPLVWLRKFGVKCLYQPYYCQQLGFFSSEEVDACVMKEMLLQANAFPYISINLNPSAKIIAGEFKLSKKKNLLLDLSGGYSILRKKYSENHRRNITKAEKAGLVFSKEVELKQFQKFYLENVNLQKENFKPQHEKIFKTLTQEVVANGTGKIFSVSTTDENLLAATLILSHQNRFINIINTSSAEGKKTGSSHFLFDKAISVIASAEIGDCFAKPRNDKSLVFDFEGSSIPTIARFYEGFGAYEETFYNYQTTILKKFLP